MAAQLAKAVANLISVKVVVKGGGRGGFWDKGVGVLLTKGGGEVSSTAKLGSSWWLCMWPSQ